MSLVDKNDEKTLDFVWITSTDCRFMIILFYLFDVIE